MTVFLHEADLIHMVRNGVTVSPAHKLRTCRTVEQFNAFRAEPQREWDDECARVAAEMQKEGFPG